MAGAQGEVVRVYRGDEFRKLIRQYSTDRMQYDRQYRNEVRAAIAKRRIEQKRASQ